MIVRYFALGLFVLVAVAGLLVPFLIDGRHWWPRKKRTK